MPNIVIAPYDSDSDTDSDGVINWKDYYGDDEEGGFSKTIVTFITLICLCI